jgi:Ternary complex associated domain 7
VRIQPVIAVDATDTVGPTRLRMLTAASSKLPVVVIGQAAGKPEYYVLDVATLQAALTDQLSATPMGQALDLAFREARAAVSKSAVPAATAGSPVVENGRVIGVIADDAPERIEPTEQDMIRADTKQSNAGESDATKSDAVKSTGAEGRKPSLWRRLSRSDN